MTEEPLSCPSDDGITTGLVDAIIAINRVLAVRDLHPLKVQEGLADLLDDPDFRTIRNARRPIPPMWLGVTPDGYVGVNEDLHVVVDALKARFAEDGEMSPEEAERRLGYDLKLMDYFVTLDGVRQRTYQAIRVDVLTTGGA